MNIIKTVALGAALAAGAPLAWAQEAEPVPIPLLLTTSADGTASASFTQGVSGLFVDTFSFTPARFNGTISVSLIGQGPVNFFAALLNGQGFSFEPETSPSGRFDFSGTVSDDMPLSLTVFGFAGDASTLLGADASYRGTITATPVAAIPEPETYALMLAGLAFVGVWAQRRKARVATAV